MGITVFFEGGLSSADEIDEVVKTAADFARRRGWETERQDGPSELFPDRPGPFRGITLQPHERSESLRLWFDAKHVLDDFCKTQFAGPQVHIEVVRLLMKIRPSFARLEVSDETGYWESGDSRDVLVAFEESPL